MEQLKKTQPTKGCRPTKAQDHFLSNQIFSIHWNQSKTVGRTILPKSIILEDYYKSEAYCSHQGVKKGLFGKAYRMVQRLMFTRKKQLLSQWIPRKARLLDYGCGVGDFLLSLKGRSYSCIGIEPHSQARQEALSKGLDVYSALEEVPASDLDVITLWHALEHLPDPLGAMKSFYSRLAPDGILLIALPNPDSWDANHYKQYWAAWDVPRHLWHFNEMGIIEMAKQARFIHQATHALPLDAFYVNLLSEKYMRRRFGSIRAVFNGLRSIGHGLRSQEFSSQIYLFQKS